MIRYEMLVYRPLKSWHTHTHTHPFNGPLSRTARVSRYQKGKANLDFTEARDIEWQWHQRGHMQVYTSLQTDNHASTPPLSFFTGRRPFLPPNQQRQSTEGTTQKLTCGSLIYCTLICSCAVIAVVTYYTIWMMCCTQQCTLVHTLVNWHWTWNGQPLQTCGSW